ncbi:MAG: hypothetical protein KGZ62_13460 [Sulfurimonas sp.]|nr:hypothetical protein [Sulfurimonas sp.]
MAKKMSAQDLRDQAKALLEKARELEDAECLELGRVVKKYVDNDFVGFDLNTFKKELGMGVEREDLKKKKGPQDEKVAA